MKTKIDIINETVAFYSEDVTRRSGDSFNCSYRNKNGNKCAVGRCLTEKSLDFIFEEELNGEAMLDILGKREVEFKPEYSHIKDVGFWQDLQNLHDRSSYWDKDGLTDIGELYVLDIKEKYSSEEAECLA